MNNFYNVNGIDIRLSDVFAVSDIHELVCTHSNYVREDLVYFYIKSKQGASIDIEVKLDRDGDCKKSLLVAKDKLEDVRLDLILALGQT